MTRFAPEWDSDTKLAYALKFLPLVARNLMRNKRRTSLTVLSVAVSLFIFAALMSLPGVVRQMLRDPANSLRLITHGKGGFFYPLPEAYRRRIEAILHVEAVVGENIFMGTYRDPSDQVRSVAIDPEDIDRMWPDFGVTRRDAQAFGRTRTASLVGETLMRRYGWRLGDQILLRGTVYPVDIQLTIVDELRGSAGLGASLLFRRDQLEYALGRLGYVHLFWVKVDRTQSIPGVIAEIDRTFANSPAETETEAELTLAQGQLSSLRVLFDGVKVLAVIVIFAIGLVAANTAAMSIRERRPEIAVMRAIGFTAETIVFCLLAEGVVIGIVGGLLGCGLAWIALRLIPYASSQFGTIVLLLRLPARVFAESMMVALAIGLASSLIPAMAATRRSISGTLRAA